MASSMDMIEYVCEQIQECGQIRYRKMFGEYMVYVNDKPVVLVCDNTVYVKEVEEIKEKMKNANKAVPYQGAKEHYILDIDDKELVVETIRTLEKVTPLPKKRK